MTGENLLFTLASCAFFMALVGWISWVKTRGTADTKEGYFLAGRGLGATFIAGSLLLTNLSAEQLIGLNGSAYGYNMSSMGWEVTAAVATIAMALIFLPRYLAGAFTTLKLRHVTLLEARIMALKLAMVSSAPGSSTGSCACSTVATKQ